jgi:hypothetical protein
MEHTKPYAEMLAKADREIADLQANPLKHHGHIKRAPECCGCPSFPYALCVACDRHNGHGDGR